MVMPMRFGGLEASQGVLIAVAVSIGRCHVVGAARDRN